MVYDFNASYLDKLLRMQSPKDAKELKDWMDSTMDRISPDIKEEMEERVEKILESQKTKSEIKREIGALGRKYDKACADFLDRIDNLRTNHKKKEYVRIVTAVALEYDKERTELAYNKAQAFNWFYELARTYAGEREAKTLYFLAEIAKAYMNDQLRAGRQAQIPDWAIVPAQEEDVRAECLMARLCDPKFPLTSEVDDAKTTYWWDRARRHGLYEDEDFAGMTSYSFSTEPYTDTEYSTLQVFGENGDERTPVIDGIKFL